MQYSYRAPESSGFYILDFKTGDVNGDGSIDNVWLVGQKSHPDDYFSDNIRIVIQDGRTNNSMQVPLKNAAGYNAQLFLGHFTSKLQSDILVSIDTGGSGGYIFAYLYSLRDNYPRLLLDADSFNESSVYTAVFKDDFRVEISDVNSNIKFMIDISCNKKMYLDAGIYNAAGRLIKATEGGVLALGALYPLINDYDGLYQLLAYQRVIGINNSDNLGAVQTYLKWDGTRIAPIRVEVAIMPE